MKLLLYWLTHLHQNRLKTTNKPGDSPNKKREANTSRFFCHLEIRLMLNKPGHFLFDPELLLFKLC